MAEFFFPKPATILNKVVSRSPLLIGWDDDQFRKVLDEYKAKNVNEHGELIRNVEEIGFGLQGIISSAVKEYVDKRSSFDDLKSDLKKFEDSKRAGLPNNKDEGSNFNLREMKLYQNLLSSVKYQRDSYIMGEDHANIKKRHRENEAEKTKERRESSLAFPFGMNSSTTVYSTYRQYLEQNPLIPQASPTLASSQLTHLAGWFIPSPTVHNAILPTVLWTISPPYTAPHYLPDGGPLRRQVIRSCSHLIPLSQPLLDRAVKNSIIWVLEDSNWRESIKGSTRGLVEKMQGDEDESSGGSGRFVTTKTVSLNH